MPLLALLVFFASLTLMNVGGSAPSSGTGDPSGTAPSGRAALRIESVRPLTLVGSGFKGGESVRVGAAKKTKRVRANATGKFRVRFTGVDSCGVGTVTAIGSQGSHAELNFSQLLCVD